MTEKQIAIVTTMDTKEAEARFLSTRVRKQGHRSILIDVGALSGGDISADYSNRKVASEGGWNLDDLVETGERDHIMSTMGNGAASILLALMKKDELDGVMGIGGNQGSAIASIAMKGLPIGFPKFLVSTVASGNIRPYVGHTDIGVMFSIADLVGGPNPVTRPVLANALSALLGMVEHGERISIQKGDRAVALSALGNTEKTANRINGILREKGFQVITFHASGAGGTAMEELTEAGVFEGVIDLTPHELTEEVVGLGAYVPVKPGRLNAAARAGIPQVVSTGGLEYLCFGPKHTIPPVLRNRKTYFHNPYNANVKASRSEMETVGKIMAERLNAAKGPTRVLVPVKGWSVYGSKGGPLFDPQGNARLLKSLYRHMEDHVTIQEYDLHINDPEFADICVATFINLLNGEPK